MSITVTRINITLPTNLVGELKKLVPERKRSEVIASALTERIARIKREESLRNLKGTWDKAGGTAFETEEDLKSWRKSLWASTEKHFKSK